MNDVQKKMADAVLRAQSVIDKCTTASNVTNVATNNISLFCDYVLLLDPSNINFDSKFFLNVMRVNNYWKTYEQYYPSLQKLLSDLGKNVKVINNTKITLEKELYELETAYDEYNKSEGMDVTQAMVAKNTVDMLTNLYNEYCIIADKIDYICSASSAVFNTAILNAKQQTSTFKQDYIKFFNTLRGTE